MFFQKIKYKKSEKNIRFFSRFYLGIFFKNRQINSENKTGKKNNVFFSILFRAFYKTNFDFFFKNLQINFDFFLKNLQIKSEKKTGKKIRIFFPFLRRLREPPLKKATSGLRLRIEISNCCCFIASKNALTFFLETFWGCALDSNFISV